MCGIIGIISDKEISKTLLDSIKKLEYRGYDSVGMACLDNNVISVKKDIGSVNEVDNRINFSLMKGNIGIAHSRWATHGGVNKENAHPHTNSQGNICVVHNGIIENYKELKTNLEKKGYNFFSQTDTEIIPHYIEDKLKTTDIKGSIQAFLKEAKGTFAVVMLINGENKLFAFKRESPLALGVGDNEFILGSDIYAFSHKTQKSIFFDDDEFAVIGRKRYFFYDSNGNEINKEITELPKIAIEEKKQDYPHFMIKEIKEQPFTSERLIKSFSTIQNENLDKLVDLIKQKEKIIFSSCGTSYHASLVGASVLNKIGIESKSIIASETESFVRFDKDTLVIAISQSGETMDVISALKNAKKSNSTICSIVNVPYSTMQRMSDFCLEILAGQEVCVASTKAFTNQVIVLLELARRLGYNLKIEGIPEKIEKTIKDNEKKVKKFAEEIYQKKDIFILGKGLGYPIAREIALKLKEIPYVHAEGMMAGELKHGTIALIEPRVPVVSLIYNDNPDMISATKEVEARGARTIIISNTNGDFMVPDCDEAEFAIYSTIIGHLLSYYIGVLKGVSIDKPRNLAKSVTVR